MNKYSELGKWIWSVIITGVLFVFAFILISNGGGFISLFILAIIYMFAFVTYGFKIILFGDD